MVVSISAQNHEMNIIVENVRELLRNSSKFLDFIFDSSLRKGVYPSQFE